MCAGLFVSTVPEMLRTWTAVPVTVISWPIQVWPGVELTPFL